MAWYYKHWSAGLGHRHHSDLSALGHFYFYEECAVLYRWVRHPIALYDCRGWRTAPVRAIPRPYIQVHTTTYLFILLDILSLVYSFIPGLQRWMGFLFIVPGSIIRQFPAAIFAMTPKSSGFLTCKMA